MYHIRRGVVLLRELTRTSKGFKGGGMARKKDGEGRSVVCLLFSCTAEGFSSLSPRPFCPLTSTLLPPLLFLISFFFRGDPCCSCRLPLSPTHRHRLLAPLLRGKSCSIDTALCVAILFFFWLLRFLSTATALFPFLGVQLCPLLRFCIWVDAGVEFLFFGVWHHWLDSKAFSFIVCFALQEYLYTHLNKKIGQKRQQKTKGKIKQLQINIHLHLSISEYSYIFQSI